MIWPSLQKETLVSDPHPDVQQTATASQQAILISQDTITKEVAEAGKAAAVILQETNNIAKAIQSVPSPKSSFASALSSNLALLATNYNIYTDLINYSSTT